MRAIDQSLSDIATLISTVLQSRSCSIFDNNDLALIL